MNKKQIVLVDELSLAIDELLLTADILDLCDEIISRQLLEELANALTK
jgi:hypothetical protein